MLGSLWGTWFGAAASVLMDIEGDGVLATMMVTVGIPLVTRIAGLALGVAATRDMDRGDASGDAGAEGSLPIPGSLLNWSDGNWALSTPLPTPVQEPTSRNDGRASLFWRVPAVEGAVLRPAQAPKGARRRAARDPGETSAPPEEYSTP